MSEIKDPAIKLFGKTIPVPDGKITAESGEKSSDLLQLQETIDEKDICKESSAEVEDPATTATEEVAELDSSSGLDDCKEEPQNHNQDDNVMADPKPEEDQTETDTNHEKVLKKPDKVIPCPRCNSLDTKFCYYNNYNVNQPRHFCKNCQRYWTAGGTMRNVPVGAGRRKNKHSASHYRHIMISDGMATARVETPDPIHNQVLSCGVSPPTIQLKGSGTVLKFGPDAPLCESIVTVLNLGDQNSKRNVEMGSVSGGENGEELSCGSSVTATTCQETEMPKSAGKMEQGGTVCNGVNPHHLQFYPGGPWAYTWNPPGWNNVATMAAAPCASELVHGPENGSSNPVQWSAPPMVSAPAFCAPSIPFPFMPASYWGCVPGWVGGTWNVPWVGSNGGLSPSYISSSGCLGNGSATLGKHSRDANAQGDGKPEKCLWVPKTLRIDDPDEAAKSSIWATLGIKNDQSEPLTKGGIFKAFQPKVEGKPHSLEATQVLHANPAALSRSQTFQESTGQVSAITFS